MVADGRSVAWCGWGLIGGRPLLRLHGTPGSRLIRNPDPLVAIRAGAHGVTYDRPRYGRSTRAPHSSLISSAGDALAVADAVGFDTFSVLGISGGGPHALALAVVAPQRLHRVAVAVGITPIDQITDQDRVLAFNSEAWRRAREQGRASLEDSSPRPPPRRLSTRWRCSSGS